jgi:hypothetical protein
VLANFGELRIHEADLHLMFTSNGNINNNLLVLRKEESIFGHEARRLFVFFDKIASKESLRLVLDVV